MFEPEVFRKQMHYTEESTCDNVGILPPFPPRYAPAVQSVILE